MQTKRDMAQSSFYTASGERTLDSVFLYSTGKCNAKCVHCFYERDTPLPPDLPTDGWKNLARTSKTVKKLWISGGEPSLREDLPDIIEEFYNNNPLTDVNMPSNGILKDRLVSWFKRLRQSCPNANLVLSVSFDGFPEAHDKQRGVPCFYKALQTIKAMDDEFGTDGHVVVNLGTCVTTINNDQIMDFFQWCCGRLNAQTQVFEGARGDTRADGVKCVDEARAKELQDAFSPYFMEYGRRMSAGMGGGPIKKEMQKIGYIGLIRSLYDICRTNMSRPTPWGMDCTAGETTLVVYHDGNFASCEMRPVIGKVQDYDCDTRKIMTSDAMKKEIAAIGHGYGSKELGTPSCWCQHSCFITESLLFNPDKMKGMIKKGYEEVKSLAKGTDIKKLTCEEALAALEDKYKLDKGKLKELGILP